MLRSQENEKVDLGKRLLSDKDWDIVIVWSEGPCMLQIFGPRLPELPNRM